MREGGREGSQGLQHGHGLTKGVELIKLEAWHETGLQMSWCAHANRSQDRSSYASLDRRTHEPSLLMREMLVFKGALSASDITDRQA